jgi:hypothetical protein
VFFSQNRLSLVVLAESDRLLALRLDANTSARSLENVIRCSRPLVVCTWES